MTQLSCKIEKQDIKRSTRAFTCASWFDLAYDKRLRNLVLKFLLVFFLAHSFSIHQFSALSEFRSTLYSPLCLSRTHSFIYISKCLCPLNCSFTTPSPFLFTSNGGRRREEKSRKHWSFFTMSSVIEIHFICYFESKAIVCIDCTKNQRKIGLSQMS